MGRVPADALSESAGRTTKGLTSLPVHGFLTLKTRATNEGLSFRARYTAPMPPGTCAVASILAKIERVTLTTSYATNDGGLVPLLAITLAGLALGLLIVAVLSWRARSRRRADR